MKIDANFSRNSCSRYILFIVCGVLLLSSGSCTINSLISESLAGALSGEDSAVHPLLSEDDPDLVKEALPFTLKFLDILISANIDDPQIQLVAAQAYLAYAGLFLQQEANTTARDDFERRTVLLERAKKHFLRARNYALAALEKRHTNFIALLNENNFELAFADITVDDVPYLYVGAISWFGAVALDAFDLELVLTAVRAVEMIDTAFELQPKYGDGALHEFYIIYYAFLPQALGGDKALALAHYQEALAASGGNSVASHLSVATGIALPEQNITLFREYLNKALAIDVNVDLNRRLTNIVQQRQAQWYLDNIDRFFIDIDSDSDIE